MHPVPLLLVLKMVHRVYEISKEEGCIESLSSGSYQKEPGILITWVDNNGSFHGRIYNSC